MKTLNFQIFNMIKYIQGDLFTEFETGQYDAMMHQANCQGVMGAGVAKFIATKYPEAAKADKKSFYENEFPYGDYSYCDTSFGKVVNLYGQFYMGPCLPDPLSMDSYQNRIAHLGKAFKKAVEELNLKSVVIPLMASGIAADPIYMGAGTSLEYFKNFVEFTLKGCDITVVYQ